jgi:hypothetical protein
VSWWGAKTGRALPFPSESAPGWKWTPFCLHAIAAGALALHRLVCGYGFARLDQWWARQGSNL